MTSPCLRAPQAIQTSHFPLPTSHFSLPHLLPPLRPSQPQALDCCEPSQLSGRTECARPALRTRHLRPSHSHFPLPPLRTSHSHFSLLTSHFLPPLRTSRSPNTPGIARLRTRPTPQALVPSDQASRRLWTAGSHHSSQGARSARGPLSVVRRQLKLTPDDN
jgi:hypothetical protein